MQAIINLPTGHYLIRNGKWMSIPIGSELADYPESIVERKVVEVHDTQVFKVQASKPGKFYTVTRNKTHYSCTCTGYGYRAKCRHIEEAKQL